MLQPEIELSTGNSLCVYVCVYACVWLTLCDGLERVFARCVHMHLCDGRDDVALHGAHVDDVTHPDPLQRDAQKRRERLRLRSRLTQHFFGNAIEFSSRGCAALTVRTGQELKSVAVYMNSD